MRGDASPHSIGGAGVMYKEYEFHKMFSAIKTFCVRVVSDIQTLAFGSSADIR